MMLCILFFLLSCVAVEDFDGSTKTVLMPANASRQGTFHASAQVSVYNDGLKEEEEGFVVLISTQEESQSSQDVHISHEMVDVFLYEGGTNSLCLNAAVV